MTDLESCLGGAEEKSIGDMKRKEDFILKNSDFSPALLDLHSWSYGSIFETSPAYQK